jgi:2-(1,2-epoxy-1,2-dihydrophenyl)acetyl-CoA isomerase
MGDERKLCAGGREEMSDTNNGGATMNAEADESLQAGAVEVEVSDGIAVVRLARPESINAASERLLVETLDALHALEANDEVGVIVLGAHEPGFSSGFDLREIPLNSDDASGIHRHFRAKALYYHAVIHLLSRIAKPTLAAVNGKAVGGGLGMVLACDIALATESATFLPAWMSIGIANDAGTSFYLSRIVGYRRAMEWLLTNRTLDAREALEWGVVNRVYSPAEFETRVGEIARQLADGPTHLQALVKTRVQEGTYQSLSECTEHEVENVLASVRHPHFRDRLHAFQTKTQRSSAVAVDMP